MIALVAVSLVFALIPAVLYFRNAVLYRPPPAIFPYVAGEQFESDGWSIRSPGEAGIRSTGSLAVSVLIPARNEEGSIAACVGSVMASRSIEWECIVLDDHSDDRTAAIVCEMSAKDARLRLATAPPLPPGWSGKQHACHELSKHAKYPILAFLDADVRLSPEALVRMVAFQRESGAALVSGFPRQITGTVLEKLLIPLIHLLLLGFLPFSRMRRTTDPGFGAGCGQLFLTTREDYDRVGGHSHPRVRGSFHDGLQLPRAYRDCGFKTDLCDVTGVARCRMYRSAGQVWNGLAKNAREGLASPKLILASSAVLLGGQVLPFALFVLGLTGFAIDGMRFDSPDELKSFSIPLAAGLAGVMLAYAPRIHGVFCFHQSPLGALLHPFGVLALLGIQWYATVRAMIGRPVGWKGRDKPGGSTK